MQIRERKTTYALIRTVYDPQRKRGVAKCLGTVPKSASQVPPQLAALLTPAELAQLERLLRHNQARIEDEKAAHYGRMLPVAIDYATRWYLDPRNRSPGLAALARDTREAFSKLLAAMVKAGVGRKRQRASAKATRASRIASGTAGK